MNKLDLIIDVLEGYFDDRPLGLDKMHKALAAARELKALKPVLWKATGDAWFYEQPLFPATPLYALDEVKHD